MYFPGPKFDRYIRIKDRQEFLRLLGRVTGIVPITYKVKACRDAKDDKVLEVAINGEAQAIIIGDRDLLSLNPFQRIRIISPAKHLKAT